MKKILLFLMLTVVVHVASAGSPESYMQLKADFKNMPVRVQKVDFIKKHLVIGVSAGAVMFAMNEYFIRTDNEAFHNIMPYVALAYGLFQSYSILRAGSMESSGGGPGMGLTICTF